MSLLQVMLFAGVMTVIALGIVKMVAQNQKTVSVIRVASSRNNLVKLVQDYAGLSKALMNSLNQAGNENFTKCVLGTGPGTCTLNQEEGFKLYPPMGSVPLTGKGGSPNPVSPLYYDLFGAQCATPGSNCPIEASTTYIGKCNSGNGCIPANGCTDTITVNYRVRQAPNLTGVITQLKDISSSPVGAPPPFPPITTQTHILGCPPLSISSLSIQWDFQNGGDTETINGSGFVPGATVKVGSNACTNVVFVSSNKLTCTLPPQTTSGTYTLTLTNPNLQSASAAVTYMPFVTSVSPQVWSAAGGMTATVTGWGFGGSTQILLHSLSSDEADCSYYNGQVNGSSVNVISNTQLTFIVPPSPHPTTYLNGVLYLNTNNMGWTQWVTTWPNYVIGYCSSTAPTITWYVGEYSLYGPCNASTYPNGVPYPPGPACPIYTGTAAIEFKASFSKGLQNTATVGGLPAGQQSPAGSCPGIFIINTPPHAPGIVSTTLTDPCGQTVTCTNCFQY